VSAMAQQRSSSNKDSEDGHSDGDWRDQRMIFVTVVLGEFNPIWHL